MFIARARSGAFAALAALLGSLALAAPGDAQAAYLPHSLTISPGATTYETPGNGEVASGETVQISATVKNEDPTQPISSADLFPPTGFAVVSSGSFPLSTTAGTASLASNCTSEGIAAGPCVELRNIAAYASVTVTMWVTTPACQQGGGFWWYVNVTPGLSAPSPAVLDGPNSQPYTTLDGACSLQFVNQPADTKTNQALSDQAFTPPPMGGDVMVRVLDSNHQPVSGSSVPVSMGLQSNPGMTTLGGTTTEPASGGTASFATLTLNKPGDPYQLAASSGTLAGATSSDFAIQDQAQFCSSGNCTSASGTSSGNHAKVSANVLSGSGFLTESVNANAHSPLACAGYHSIDPNNYVINAPSSWSKVIKIAIDPSKKFRTRKGVLKAQQICFQAPYRFRTASGRPATPAHFPDGTPGFIGLLPRCGRGVTGPCHNRRADGIFSDLHDRHDKHEHSKGHFDIVLVADVPSGLPGDPRCG